MTKPSLSIEDLKAVYVRVQVDGGRLGSVNLAEASDAQFTEWITSRIGMVQAKAVVEWSPANRAAVCDQLWQSGSLTIIASQASPAIQSYLESLKLSG